MIVRIETDQVVRLHQMHVRAGPLLHPDKLDAAVAAPFQHVFGRELYETVPHKAAKLVEGISRAQAFLDGNKRVAWLALMVFLEGNGLVICHVDQDAAAGFVLGLSGDDVGLRAGARWLNDHLQILR